MQSSWTFKVCLSDVQVHLTCHTTNASADENSTNAHLCLRLAFDGKVTDLPLPTAETSCSKELHSFTYAIDAESEAALAVSLAQRYVTCQLIRPSHDVTIASDVNGVEQSSAEVVYGEWRSTLLALIVAANSHYTFTCHEENSIDDDDNDDEVRQPQCLVMQGECVAFVLTMEEEQTMVIQPQAMRFAHLPLGASFGLVYSAEVVPEATLSEELQTEREGKCEKEAVAAATTRMRMAVRRGSSAMTPILPTILAAEKDKDTSSPVHKEEEEEEKGVLHFTEAQLPRLQVRITQSTLPRVRLTLWLLRHSNQGTSTLNGSTSTSLTSGLAAMAQVKLWAVFESSLRPIPAAMEACDVVTQRFDLISSLVRDKAHKFAVTMDCTLMLSQLPCFRSLTQLAIADADLTSVLTASSASSTTCDEEKELNASSVTPASIIHGEEEEAESKILASVEKENVPDIVPIEPHTPRNTAQPAARPLPTSKPVPPTHEERNGKEEEVLMVVHAEPIQLSSLQAMSDEEDEDDERHAARSRTSAKAPQPRHSHNDKPHEPQAHPRELWNNALLTPSHSLSDIAASTTHEAAQQQQQSQECSPGHDVQQISSNTHRTLYLPPRSPPRETGLSGPTNNTTTTSNNISAHVASVEEDYPLPMPTIDAPLSYIATPVQQPQSSFASHASLSPALTHYVPTSGVYHELLSHREHSSTVVTRQNTTSATPSSQLHIESRHDAQPTHASSTFTTTLKDDAMVSVMEQKAVMAELQRIKQSCHDTLHRSHSAPREPETLNHQDIPTQEVPVMREIASVHPAERKLSLGLHSIPSTLHSPHTPVPPQVIITPPSSKPHTPHTPRQPRPTHQASQCGPHMSDKATATTSLTSLPQTHSRVATATQTEKEIEKEKMKVVQEDTPDEKSPSIIVPQPPQTPPITSTDKPQGTTTAMSSGSSVRASMYTAKQPSNTNTTHVSSNAGLSRSPSHVMQQQQTTTTTILSTTTASTTLSCRRPSSAQVAAACTSQPHRHERPRRHSLTCIPPSAPHSTHLTRPPPTLSAARHQRQPMQPTNTTARRNSTSSSNSNTSRTSHSVHKSRLYERTGMRPSESYSVHPYNQPRPATSQAATAFSARSYFTRPTVTTVSPSSASHVPHVSPTLTHPYHHSYNYNAMTARYDPTQYNTTTTTTASLHLPHCAMLRRCSSARETSMSSTPIPLTPTKPNAPATTMPAMVKSSTRRVGVDPLCNVFCRQGHTGWVYVEDSVERNDKEVNGVDEVMSERRSVSNETNFFDSPMHLSCPGSDVPFKERLCIRDKHTVVSAWQ